MGLDRVVIHAGFRIAIWSKSSPRAGQPRRPVGCRPVSFGAWSAAGPYGSGRLSHGARSAAARCQLLVRLIAVRGAEPTR